MSAKVAAGKLIAVSLTIGVNETALDIAFHAACAKRALQVPARGIFNASRKPRAVVLHLAAKAPIDI